MSKAKKGTVALGSLAFLCLAAYVSASYILSPAVQDSGGGHAESAGYQVDASIGGPVIVTGAASGQTASSPSYTCEVGGIAVIEPGPSPGGGGGGGCNATRSGVGPLALLLPLGVLIMLELKQKLKLKRRRGAARA